MCGIGIDDYVVANKVTDPMPGIIADFERPFRRDARAMGLNLLDDTDFWTFLKTRFEQGIISKGIEPMDLPATLELGDGEFLPRIAHGQVVAQCPDCDGWTLVRKDAAEPRLLLLLGQRRNTSTADVVAWPDDKVAIEEVLLARPRYINRNWQGWGDAGRATGRES